MFDIQLIDAHEDTVRKKQEEEEVLDIILIHIPPLTFV